MFTNYHLAISKEQYLKQAYQFQSGLNIQETERDFKTYYNLLQRVGGPWGWDRRPKYYAEMESLKERVYNKGSHLFLLNNFNTAVGYCFAIKRNDLTSTFNRHAVTEIENFGLFLEHTGKGYGRTFLPLVFEKLFEENDLVYLTTRSTNHAKVVPFYTSLGMQVIKTEELEDDLTISPSNFEL